VTDVVSISGAGEELARNATVALARASAALVGDHDVQGFLVSLLRSSAEVLSVDASAVMVHDSRGLELLAASSHVAEELELHQLQAADGPCREAYATGTPVSERGAERLRARWPDFGASLVSAGFLTVHSVPMRWHDDAIGVLGVFRHSDIALTADEQQIAQAFADIATLVVAQAPGISINERVDDVLTTRVVIEVAKGVIAELENIGMAEAYDRLVQRADSASLDAVAKEIIKAAQRGNS
jgi:transcriptional regulator with GAF, ATPase, and Fis domain